MARTDVHLDATLRHLGAAYYDSLHGRAARPDVTRALEAVEEQFKTQQRLAGRGHGPGGGPLETAGRPGVAWGPAYPPGQGRDDEKSCHD